ncbi:hypothetical protein ACJBU6_01561 [Exserohilum turcicum]
MYSWIHSSPSCFKPPLLPPLLLLVHVSTHLDYYQRTRQSITNTPQLRFASECAFASLRNSQSVAVSIMSTQWTVAPHMDDIPSSTRSSGSGLRVRSIPAGRATRCILRG